MRIAMCELLDDGTILILGKIGCMGWMQEYTFMDLELTERRGVLPHDSHE